MPTSRHQVFFLNKRSGRVIERGPIQRQQNYLEVVVEPLPPVEVELPLVELLLEESLPPFLDLELRFLRPFLPEVESGVTSPGLPLSIFCVPVPVCPLWLPVGACCACIMGEEMRAANVATASEYLIFIKEPR